MCSAWGGEGVTDVLWVHSIMDIVEYVYKTEDNSSFQRIVCMNAMNFQEGFPAKRRSSYLKTKSRDVCFRQDGKMTGSLAQQSEAIGVEVMDGHGNFLSSVKPWVLRHFSTRSEVLGWNTTRPLSLNWQKVFLAGSLCFWKNISINRELSLLLSFVYVTERQCKKTPRPVGLTDLLALRDGAKDGCLAEMQVSLERVRECTD